MTDRDLQQAAASLDAGDYARAEALCEAVLGRDRYNPEALRLLGILRLQGGRPAEAIALLRGALQGDPSSLSALAALSSALMDRGEYAQAEAAVRRALAISSDLPLAHLRLGVALGAQGRWREAAVAFAEAARLDPHLADAQHGLGRAQIQLGELAGAERSLRAALAIEPQDADAHCDLGIVLQQRADWDSALVHYQRALALNPESVLAHYNLALLRLARREFDQAWQGYERRLELADLRASFRKDAASLDRYAQLPHWRGPGEAGVREVAIWAEQGLGDQVLFSTQLPEVIASGVRVVCEVDARLLPAYQRSFPEQRFVATGASTHPALLSAQRVLLAGSLPGYFRHSVADFARQPTRLLRAAPERTAHYRQRLAAAGAGLKVALSWRSTREDYVSARKNVALLELAPLLKLDGVRFVNVQYGDTAGEERAVEAATGVRLLTFEDVDRFDDLDELLAILEACDLLITVSNATAHLAGALGIPTWLLYPGSQPPFHYWARAAGQHSLWYPSVEIIAGPRFPDWTGLVQHAAQRLAAMASTAPPSAAGAQPRDAQGWFELGRERDAGGELAQAVQAYRRALELQPDHAQAWSNLGAALGDLGEKAGEIAAYRRALAIDPGLAPVWSNLGNALRETLALGEAVEACRHAVGLDPAFAAGWNNLGNALHDSGEDQEAVFACERALKLAPGLAEAWSTLGAAWLSLRRYDEAIRAQQTALASRPGVAQFHFNLGVTLRHADRDAEAIASLRRAVELDPHHALAHYELGIALLREGELRAGWDEYEWRWRLPKTPPRRYDFAPWDGDVSRPARLLLWGEQGIGDHILFASMAADLADSPLQVTLEIDRRLVPLYRRSLPRFAVIAQEHPPQADRGAFDCQAPLPDLGRWLRPSLGSFPRRAYLKADAGRAAGYRSRLLEAAAGARARVGISWRSTNPELGRLKSHALDDWLELLRAPGAQFVDLQYGDTAHERSAAERLSGARIEHLPELDLYHDLDGLAALCGACDLVITVSNVTAHVAGALGRPVWLLVPKANGRLWYWLARRTDSPWYPSVRVYTQHKAGSWREMLAAVAADLAGWLARGD